MEDKIEIINLLQNKQMLERELNSLEYGSIEIRQNASNKYIYVHLREDGIPLTKYIGEYSEELYNLILNNSIRAKQLKKQIREISKQLKNLNYIEEKLDSKVELNIDFAKRHLVETIYKQAVLEGVATTYADTENIIEGGKVIKEILGKNKDIDLMRNVSGEIQGCLKAIEYGIENHYPFICIYYDYTGIEKWAIKEWKANKRGTIEYQNKIQQYI